MTRRTRPRLSFTGVQLRLRPVPAALAAIGNCQVQSIVAHSTLLSAGLLLAGLTMAEQVSTTALPSAPTVQYPNVGSIKYTIDSAAAKGVITQTDPTNIIKWESFDIGKDAKLQVIQPSANSVLLNKVEGSNPSYIFGQLTANGRVYIYNPDGVVFGPKSVVNVNTLIASSLKFDESRVISGLVTPGALPVLSGSASSGSVSVQNGARIVSTDAGGQIILAAPNVSNSGKLVAKDGQVILAAGQKVYLAAPPGTMSSKLRGLVVEVVNDPSNPTVTSTAENAKAGVIDVGRGNATMVGFAVNQNGMISAKTSVNLNGSIYLTARDKAEKYSATTDAVAKRSGELVLGAESVTKVSLDTDDKSTLTADTQSTFKRSEIVLDAGNILLKGNDKAANLGGKGAQVIAPSGIVTMTATSREFDLAPRVDPANDLYRVDIAKNVLVDVSGSKDTTLAMDSNVITVDLRGTELADNTVLRDSSLYGTKVQIDIRKGTPAADVSGWLKQVPVGLGQLTSNGGTVNFKAASAVIQRPGSTINLDGGWIDYTSGYVNTTQLILGGKLVDIGSAKANTPYTAAVNLSNGSANFELGYRQGASAGTVDMSSPIMVMQGSLSGKAVSGARQRDLTAADAPKGGELKVGSKDAMFGNFSHIVVGGTSTATLKAPLTGAPFNVSSNAVHQLLVSTFDVDTAALSKVGFNRFTAVTSGNISVDKKVELAPGGQLSLTTAFTPGGDSTTSGNVFINADISIPSGSLEAKASRKMTVADGVTMDVAGRWTNDRSASSPSRFDDGTPNTPVLTKGGSVSLTSPSLTLGTNVAIDVSAGSWMKENSSLVTGSAGSVSLDAAFTEATDTLQADTRLKLGSGLTLSGFGFNSGGKLKLVGRTAWIGSAAVPDTAPTVDLLLSPLFFTQGGFTSYNIGANLNLTVAADTTLKPVASSWLLNTSASVLPSGRMASVAQPTLLPLASAAATRPATDLTLRAMISPAEAILDPLTGLYKDSSSGRVLVDTGASIALDPLGKLSLFAGRQVTVDGTLSSAGGAINLGISGDGLYRDDRSVWLGSNANVSVRGSNSRVYTDPDGVSYGSPLDGGSIRITQATASGSELAIDDTRKSLVALPGYVVMAKTATLNADGASQQSLKFRSNGSVSPATTVAGSGGSIDIRARDGLLLDGTMSAAGGAVKSAGGSLNIALDMDGTGNPFISDLSRILNISTDQDKKPSLPSTLVPDTPIIANMLINKKTGEMGWFVSGTKPAAAVVAGSGWVSPSSFASGSFGTVTLKSQDVIRFGLSRSNFGISTRDALIIEAPNIAAEFSTATARTLTLTSPYIRMGSSDYRYQSPVAAAEGAAVVVANARTIDLIGNSSMQGISDVRLNASADVRLTGVETNNSGRMAGSLSILGNLAITGAQTYPTTMSDFLISAGSGATKYGMVSFANNGNVPGSVLSAGGSLTAYAPRIKQSGRVLAPFGSITLGNLDPRVSPIITSDVQFTAGSVTSVAGNGVIPFGSISNGDVPSASDWGYQLTDGTRVSIRTDAASGQATVQGMPPSKSITANGQSLSVATGATLDLSGGGSLFAYEFTAGKGGSKDILSNPLMYAVNPAFRNGVAPVDAQYVENSSIAPGSSVYLSGVPGLPAGVYTLLPGHYALLQGSFAVTAAAGTRDLQPDANIVLPDGVQLVAGRFIAGGSGGGETRNSGFYVMSREVVSKKSNIAITDATSYFGSKSTKAELPTDGGSVALNLGSIDGSFGLAGKINLAASQKGRNGSASFSAPNIKVVGSGDFSDETGMVIAADKLTQLGADSLLLGGLRKTINGQTVITTIAGSVTLANDANNPLKAPEVVLAANSDITLGSGSVLSSYGQMSHAPAALVLDASAPNASILRVAGSAPVTLSRPSGISSSTITINPQAQLSAVNGSTLIDATGKVDLSVAADFNPGNALWLGSKSIAFDTSKDGKGTLGATLFNANRVSQLNALSWLNLVSRYASIDVYDSLTLGNDAMMLALTAPGLRNMSIGSLALKAGDLRVAGVAASDGTVPLAGKGSGSFSVQSSSLALGNNVFALSGFADYSIKSTAAVLASGKNGSLTADSSLVVETSGFVTANAASASLSSAGNLNLKSNDKVVQANGYAGEWNFATRGDLEANAAVVSPSGRVGMAADGKLTLSGKIDVSGASVSFGSTTAYAPGGTISLSGGQVVVDSTGSLDVSAAGEAGGAISVQAHKSDATGSSQILGALKGSGLGTQGTFSLDVDKIGAQNFTDLNTKLNNSGFTESRSLRARVGDIAVTSDILAQNVTIIADNGNVGVNATIDARGSKGGSIGLYASQSLATGNDGRVTLNSDARLLASATGLASDTGAGTSGNGGYVELSASNVDGSLTSSVSDGASINLKAGSQIDVSGASSKRGGSIVLRAPRTSDNADISIAALAGKLIGSSDTRLEALKTYSATQITEATDNGTLLSAGTSGAMYKDAAEFALNGSTILSRLSKTTDATVNLSPGVEVRSDGDLRVSVNEFASATNAADRGWNLSGWRFANSEGGQLVPTLTLRAKGNLNIIGSISDGFDKPANSALAMPNWALSSGRSSSMRLIGGADLTAANPLSILRTAQLSSAGDVLIDFARKSTSDTNAPVTIKDMPVAMVRSGTGRIDIAAGRDLTMGMTPLFLVQSADLAEDGTPQLYDAAIYDGYGGYLVPQFGATVYTAGKSVVLNTQAAPSNFLNTHFGAASGVASAATFGGGGGAITLAVGGNINGPSRGDIKDVAARDGSYYRKPGTSAVLDDPDTPKVDESEPGVAGEKVYQQLALPNLVNSWLFRQGRAKDDGSFETTSNGTVLATAWWARPEYFNQGIATLGGGDIAVRAGGNVSNLSVSAATNARVDSTTKILNEQGGGDVSVRAGQDIRGGSLYVQKGNGLLRADGAITSGNLAGIAGDVSTAMNPVIALGDAKVNVTTAGSAAVESTYNPMLAAQSLINLGGRLDPDMGEVTALSDSSVRFRTGVYRNGVWDTTNLLTRNVRDAFSQFSNFSTYAKGSSLTLLAIGGSAQLLNDKTTLERSGGHNIFVNKADEDLGSPFQTFNTYAPPTLALRSLTADISSQNGFAMTPDAAGQLILLAKDSVNLRAGNGGPIRMLDTDPLMMSSVAKPRVMSEIELSVITGSTTNGISAHMQGGLHTTDTAPVQIVALQGDITGDSNRAVTINMPKAVDISAARDIRDLGMRIQHNSTGDVSRISAGRDFINSLLSADASDDLRVSNVIGGGGRLEVSAGRNIDLGTGFGFRTRGSLDNPYLSDAGASVVLRAGADKIDYVGFTAFAKQWGSVLDLLDMPESGDYKAVPNSASYKALIEYVSKRDTSIVIEDSKAGTDTDKANYAANVWAAFFKLPAADRAKYLAGLDPESDKLNVNLKARNDKLDQLLASKDYLALNTAFFQLLREASKDKQIKPLPDQAKPADIAKELTKPFDTAIAKLFPTGSGGDISVFSSQVKTEQGGSIDMFAPYGSIYAGLTVAPNKPADQGLFTIRGGSISSVVYKDFLVNQGRVFTLGSGDITLITQTGNIDAGRGAKTASSAPPPIVTISPNGNVQIDVSSSISGSGIATLQTKTDQAPSDVYPVAPRGIFDAGDAGVRSSGSIEVTANVVLNSNNLSAGGSISGSGVAVAPAAPPVAPPSAAAAQQTSTSKSVNQETPKKDATLSVELLGYGDEEVDPGDPKKTRPKRKN